MNTATQSQIDAEFERLAALRMQMLEMHPFWGYLLLQMKLVPALELPALAATDMIKHIWFNPVLTDKLDIRELGFVLVHEICHQALYSSARQDGREEFKWNIATDYAINAIVADIKIPGTPSWDDSRLYKLPENVLYDPDCRNMIAEVIYEYLRKIEWSNSPVIRKIVLPLELGKPLRFPVVSDHCGGIDIHLPLELNADQQDSLNERLMAAVENYHANSGRGHLPEDLLRSAGLLEPPRIPWQRVLHRYTDTIINRDDYSLVHPNKNYLLQDFIVPGHYNESIGSMVVALDTSGSMEEETIRAVAKEIRSMLPHAMEVTLIVADNAIKQVVPFEHLEEVIISGEFLGGGGTDHICVFEYIAQHHLNPRLFIGLSDLYSSFPDEKPPYPVLWLVPAVHAMPPWGKVIEL